MVLGIEPKTPAYKACTPALRMNFLSLCACSGIAGFIRSLIFNCIVNIAKLFSEVYVPVYASYLCMKVTIVPTFSPVLGIIFKKFNFSLSCGNVLFLLLLLRPYSVVLFLGKDGGKYFCGARDQLQDLIHEKPVRCHLTTAPVLIEVYLFVILFLAHTWQYLGLILALRSGITPDGPQGP